jgi:hypothetical protein
MSAGNILFIRAYRCTNLVEHAIKLSEPIPFKVAYRRIPPGMFEQVGKHLKDMLEAGVIRESHRLSVFSNIVLIRKKDKSLGFCVDYRMLNNRIIKNAYAVPGIDETIGCLIGSNYLTVLKV